MSVLLLPNQHTTSSADRAAPGQQCLAVTALVRIVVVALMVVNHDVIVVIIVSPYLLLRRSTRHTFFK